MISYSYATLHCLTLAEALGTPMVNIGEPTGKFAKLREPTPPRFPDSPSALSSTALPPVIGNVPAQAGTLAWLARRACAMPLCLALAFGFLPATSLRAQAIPLKLSLEPSETPINPKPLPGLANSAGIEVNRQFKGSANLPAGIGLAAEGAAAIERSTLGPGDQMTLTVYGQPEMSAEVTVNENGQITLPLIGLLKVSGATPPKIEQLIAQRLREGDYLRNPEVSVQVKLQRSQMVSILGEVQRPGRYPLAGKLTVLDALATAGGTTPKADRVVLIMRRSVAAGASAHPESATRTDISVNLDQLSSSQADQGFDLELKTDDVVYVSPQRMVYVHGEVRRPGAYPMEPGLNIMRMLALSGGISDRGSSSRIVVHRMNASNQLEELDVQAETILIPGDVVFVKERLF